MVCGCSSLGGAKLDPQQRETPSALSLPKTQPKPKILFVQRLQLRFCILSQVCYFWLSFPQFSTKVVIWVWQLRSSSKMSSTSLFQYVGLA